MSEETKNENATPEAKEDTQPVAKETSEAKPEEATTADEHTVPVSALQREREKAATKISELETKLAKVAEAEEARQREELSEIEKAKLDAEKAQAKAKELETALVQEQRKQVALSAASTAGFRDPSDALPFVDLSGDVTPEDITEAVGKVLEEKPYLKAEDPKGPKQTSGVEDGNEADTPKDNGLGSVLSDAARLIGR